MAKNEEIEISKLIPYENNARTHSDEQLEYIVNSFNEFKAINPIIIDENNMILAGHGRVEAAKRAGLEKLPFRRVDWLTEEQKRAYILADNQISDKSGWDEELKNIELEDIELDMSLFGFDDIDLDFSFDYDDGRRSHLHHNVFENQEQQQYFTDNYFGIPVLDATQTTGDKFIRFCDWKEIEDPKNYIAHFYYDDYKFIAAWRQPDKYIERLKQFKAVISPDFSLYTDFPRALQILSCYRRNWCGAYWAENGIDVIPDVVWGDAQSYDYCFEGIPKNSVVAVSSVGVKLDKDWNGSDGELFVEGYNEMIRRLNPTKILFYGDMIDGCGGNIIQIPSYYAEKRKLLNERAKAKKSVMGRGSSGATYKQAVDYIKKNGIPKSFFHGGNENVQKEVFSAISRYGKLTEQEKTVYDKIKYFKDEGRLYYNGTNRQVKGYTDAQIDGAKKFMAHGVVTNKRQ